MTTPWEVRRAWTARLVEAGAKHADVTVALVIRDFVWTDDGFDLIHETIAAHSTLKLRSIGRSVKRLREAGALVTRRVFGPAGKLSSLRYFPVWTFDLELARRVLVPKRGDPWRGESPSARRDRQSPLADGRLTVGQAEPSPSARCSTDRRPGGASPSATAGRALVFPEIYPEESSGDLGLSDLRSRNATPETPPSVAPTIELLAAQIAPRELVPGQRIGYVRALPPPLPVVPKDMLTTEEREESLREIRERRLLCAQRTVLARTTPFRGQDDPA